MYLIRLPSGREASFATLQELAGAIQRGDVQREALIFHRRTNQWLPIDRHPHFFAQVSSGPPAADSGTLAPLEPVAPTPLETMRPPSPPARNETLRPAPPSLRPDSPPPQPAPRPDAIVHPPPPRSARFGGRTALIAGAIILVGGAAGLAIGWTLRPGERGATDTFRYQPAPAPSTILRPEPAAPPPVSRPAPRRSTRQSDPLAPVTAATLADRRAAAFAASRAQLDEELAEVGLPQVFGVRALASPEGARGGRRIVAAALNVVGQFHRREIMMDQAYRDTAAFQATRAGWSAEERKEWDTRASLREPYSSADLAESLLADADSLLGILARNPFSIRGDTLDFGDSVIAASYRAQRARIAERSGPPVSDPDRRPTLAHVQRSISALQLPEGAR